MQLPFLVEVQSVNAVTLVAYLANCTAFCRALASLELVEVVNMKRDIEYLQGYSKFRAGKYLDGRPGNYVLMKKQRFNCERAIVAALADKMVCLHKPFSMVLS